MRIPMRLPIVPKCHRRSPTCSRPFEPSGPSGGGTPQTGSHPIVMARLVQVVWLDVVPVLHTVAGDPNGRPHRLSGLLGDVVKQPGGGVHLLLPGVVVGPAAVGERGLPVEADRGGEQTGRPASAPPRLPSGAPRPSSPIRRLRRRCDRIVAWRPPRSALGRCDDHRFRHVAASDMGGVVATQETTSVGK
jgi:hypothetical protein